MKNYKISEVSEKELGCCAWIIKRSFKEKWQIHQSMEAILKRLQNERQLGLKLYILGVEDKMIGVVGLRRYEEGYYEMEKLSVLPVYRQLGYGSCLIEFVIKQVKAKGGGEIEIGVRIESIQLRNWYKRKGFEEKESFQFKSLSFKVQRMIMKV